MKSSGCYPHNTTAQAASPAALPFCRMSCLAPTMNNENVPQFCHSPGSCQGSLLTQPSKTALISRVPLAGLHPGESSSVVYRRKSEPEVRTKSNHSEHSVFTFRTELFYMGTFILIKICTFKSHMLSYLTEPNTGSQQPGLLEQF